MPTYEYECKTDNIKQELILSMNHEKPKCEICGQDMTQVFFAAPVHFKTGGFYSTGG